MLIVFVFFLLVGCGFAFSPLRKRRRQLYHSKKLGLKKNVATARKKMFKGRKTKDGGAWDKELPKARTLKTIQEKLEVVQFYRRLKAEKKQALQDAQEPAPAKATRIERKKLREQKHAARQTLRQNLNKICQQKFPWLQYGAVNKWNKICSKESWEQIPEQVRVRCFATTNKWRLKLGLCAKGRPLGGFVPLPLQYELDALMMESTSGMSSVSSRKDIVTEESVVS